MAQGERTAVPTPARQAAAPPGDPGPVLMQSARRKAPLFALVVVAVAVAAGAVTVVRLGALGDRVPGVESSAQLAPVVQAAVHSVREEFADRDAGNLAARDGVLGDARAELRAALEAGSSDVAVNAWWQDDTAVVVAVAEVDDPAGLAAAIDAAPRSAALPSVRTWTEGERFVVVVAAGPGPPGANGPPDAGAVAAVADEATAGVRAWTRVARAGWLVVSALGPALALVVVYGVVYFAYLLVRLALLLVWVVPGLVWFFLVRLPLALLTKGRLGSRRAPQARHRHEAPRVPGLADGVSVVELGSRSRWTGGWRGTTLWSVLGLAAALPALTPTFWPMSVVWTAAAALVLIPGSLGLRGAAVTWTRRLVLGVAAVSLVNSLFGVGPRSRLAAVAGAVVVVAAGLAALIANGRRRWGGGPSRRYVAKGADVGLRSTVYLVSGLVTLLAGMCLFLGSNGDRDAISHAVSKGMAVAFIATVPYTVRRYRAARDAAQRAWARRNDVGEVLLLRSFVDDDLDVRSRMADREGLERFALRWKEPFEDVMVRAVENIGPVVAIAKPGTRAGEFGAARERILVADWLTAVKAAMAKSVNIVAILGRGEGLRTELATLAELQLLGRVCLVVPPIDGADAAARLAEASNVLGGVAAGWGDLRTDEADGNRVLALVGDGTSRFVVVCPDRNSTGAYMQLGAWLATSVWTASDHDPHAARAEGRASAST